MTPIQKLLKDRIIYSKKRYAESGGDRDWENCNWIAIMEAMIELLEVKEISSKPAVKCGLPYHKCDDCGTEYYSNGRCPECSPMG